MLILPRLILLKKSESCCYGEGLTSLFGWKPPASSSKGTFYVTLERVSLLFEI